MSLLGHGAAAPQEPPRFDSPNLARLDAATECAICKSVFSSPVSIACGHSFCSRCIRDALPITKRCPSCNEPAKEGEIRRNRALEEISDAWTTARPDLIALQAKAKRPPLKRPVSTSSDPTSTKRARASSRQGSVSASGGAVTNGHGKSSSSSSSPTRMAPRPARNGRENAPIEVGGSSDGEREVMASEEEEQEEEDFAVIEATAPDHVACPVCNKQVPIASVNAHLDRGCKDPPTNKNAQVRAWGTLMGGKETSEDMSKLKKISKPNYNLAKEKDLRGILDEHELPIGGDKATLTERLQIWISLYNSNLDSSHPKPIARLRAELKRQEEGMQRDRRDAKAAKEKFSAEGIEENKESDDAIFRRLIAETRARKEAAARAKQGS